MVLKFLDPIDILGCNYYIVNEDVVIEMSKETTKSIEEEKQTNCKILKFTAEWNFDEVLSTISRLESQNYPKLFIFIIEAKNFGFFEPSKEKVARKMKILQEKLLNFNKNRSMVLQLTSKDENIAKFYYKEEDLEEFSEIKEQAEEIKDFEDFPTFLWLYLNDKIENIYDEIKNKLSKLKNSSLILKFLLTFKTSQFSRADLMLICGSFGSASDALTVIDGSTDEYELISKNILENAIDDSNLNVIKFVMENYKNLTEQMSFINKVTISSAAYQEDIDFLAQLLDLEDFPFPNNYTKGSPKSERLRKIERTREAFHRLIDSQNLQDIVKFVHNNPNLKFIYDMDNNPAYAHALNSAKFQSFLCLIECIAQNLHQNSLKYFLIENKMLCAVTSSNIDITSLEKFIEIIKNKTDYQFISEMFKAVNRNRNNSFVSLMLTENFGIKKIIQHLEIIQKFLHPNDVIEVISACDKYGRNAFIYSVKQKLTIEFFKMLWGIIEKSYKILNIPHEFRALISRESYEKRTILHFAASWHDLTFHEELWELLLATFVENPAEFKDVILQVNDYGNSYLSRIINSEKPDIVKFVFNKINSYPEILKSKSFQYKSTFLQYAACLSKNLETHQVLWEIYKNSCKSDQEFLDILKEVDSFNGNVFINAACFNTGEIFKFMIDELIKIGTNEDIRAILRTQGHLGMTMLQMAAEYNKSVELHEMLWKTMSNYFDYSEISDILKHSDVHGRNLLFTLAEKSTQEISELTFDKVKDIFEEDELEDFLKSVNKNDENVIHALFKTIDEKKLRVFWTEFESCLIVQEFKELLSQKTTENEQNFLHYAAKKDKIEIHETLWDLLTDTFDELQDLMDLILQKDKNGNNFIHHVVISINSIDCVVHNNNAAIIDFTFKKFREIFSNDQLDEILRSKGQKNRNILQIAVCESKNVDAHEILWKNFFKSKNKLLNFFKDVDNDNNNVLHLAVCFAEKSNIFELITKNLKKVASAAEIKAILSTTGCGNLNLLEMAARFSKCLELYQDLWEFILKYFNITEMLNIITKTDENGNNILFNSFENDNLEITKWTFIKILDIFQNNESTLGRFFKSISKKDENIFHTLVKYQYEEYLKFIWTEIKIYLTKENLLQYFKDLLMQKDSENQTILHIAAKYNEVNFHKILWKLLLNTFDDRQELKNFFKEKDRDGKIYIEILLNTDMSSTARPAEGTETPTDTEYEISEVMQFTLGKHIKFFGEEFLDSLHDVEEHADAVETSGN